MDILDRLKSTYNMNESCELAINSIKELRNLVDERESEITSLRNQLAECQKDAERIQYLNEYGMPWINSGELPSDAIDRAISEKG